MEFACVKFGKVKKNTEFIAILHSNTVKNGSVFLDYDDLELSTYISMQSFYKIADPASSDYNAVSLATGQQYWIENNIEVFICE